jgi:Ni/Fe-hydrogenase subunit HybB-like protein
MRVVGIPMILGIIAVSVGVPLIFILGVRRLVYRLTDDRTMAAVVERDVLPMPPIAIEIGTGWQAIRTLLMVGVLGTGTALILLRFVFGIGAVTNLSDAFPLGLWIGFDVMGGVALAAGAFVIAGMAHIFRVEKLEPLVRPAILTGLLGYLMAVASLLVDLGRPYNVWRPLIHWQHRSPLWEVGVCVAIYTTVLLIEFMPVILERLNTFEAITKRLPTVPLYRFLRRFSIVFVILGVVLSTMHQSSLGSLWVLVPQKLHPLWYTIRLPVLFWLSAVAAGFAMTIVESTLSSKAFKRGLERDLLADIAKYAAVMLVVYLVVKFVDLAARGGLPYLTERTLQTGTFWAEVILGGVVPILLFSIRPLRRKPAALFTGAAMVVLFGIVLNRLNVSMIGLYPYTGVIYTPSWMEIVVSVTIISLGVLAFGAAARYLPVFPEEAAHGGTV